jgi:hypothetical protein
LSTFDHDVATSFDGIHWTKENGGRPVSGLLGDGQFELPPIVWTEKKGMEGALQPAPSGASLNADRSE